MRTAAIKYDGNSLQEGLPNAALPAGTSTRVKRLRSKRSERPATAGHPVDQSFRNQTTSVGRGATISILAGEVFRHGPPR